MREFDVCLHLCKKERKINERIEEINTKLYTPKCQDLSGMPKGGGNSESFLDKLVDEKLELLDKRAEVRVMKEHNQKAAILLMKHCNISDEQQHLIASRFFNGLKWKKCGVEMTKYTGEKWDENKVFRTYRSILSRIEQHKNKLLEHN